MKHILILTCSTGEGHNSAARAVEAALVKKGYSCELEDPVSFQSARMQHTVASLYNNLIKKTPAAFGAIYKLGDLYSNTNLPSPIYWANAKYADKLKAFILTKKFDAVICTHLYGMEAMTAIRKDPDFHIPCYGILTDYTSIPFMAETVLDGYFAPTQEVKEYLVSKGIPEESIWVSGIPVNSIFRDHLTKAAARKKLKIPMDRKVYLIMTGGIGCENMIGLCRKLLHSLQPDGLILVLTGKNKKLKHRLDERYRKCDQISTIAFTKHVPDFMAACDVMLSKPGGLSSTEAAVCNVPLVHVHAIPGCETYNARFFASHGMSFNAEDEATAVACAARLVYNLDDAAEMCRMQRKYVNPNAAEMIVQKVTE